MKQMRELFEKWAKSECLDTDSVDGFYSDNDTHIAWKSWQAAQSAAVPTKLPTDAAYRWLIENGVEPESTVHALGKRLAELLDEDQFAECETLLCKIVAQSVPVVGDVVAWRCKDYGDGWILEQIKDAASAYQSHTGCLMQELVVKPTTSITAAELDDLRKDAEYVKTYKDCAPIPISALNYLAENWPAAYAKFYQQIDAAIAGEKNHG